MSSEADQDSTHEKDEEEDDVEMIESEISCDDDDDDDSGENNNSEDEEISGCEARKCIVCLRYRKFTEDIYDAEKEIYYHVDVLLNHLSLLIKKPPKIGRNVNKSLVNTGVCPECMDHLQRWHIFYSAIGKRNEAAKESKNELYSDEPLPYESFQARIYRNYKKMSKVKEVFFGATHAYYARRHLTEKDWDFFCDHLFHSNSVKSEKSRELERFVMSREKLSHLYCTQCKKLVPNGKKGYRKHMESDHGDLPVTYPCDICGCLFPDKDMTASTEDYYPHWISHFYFNKCDDCGKSFPTKRALGQHRHAVHKNRQVKCEKCGKVLANKMSLDLHILRHLPDHEKKKYTLKCSICQKNIAQLNMKSHMATHNDERPWKCDQCEATFKTKGALVSHRDVVHFNLKNHVCSICNEAFKSASSLRGHVRKHEGRKDYKCDICLKEYFTYSALKGHKVVHQTARDFVCEVCGKAFKKKKALDEHSTIHTGEKPHQCPICGREVRVKSNLYKHMKIHKKNGNVDMTLPLPQNRASNVTCFPTSSAGSKTKSHVRTIVKGSNDSLIMLHEIRGNDSMSSSSNLEISLMQEDTSNQIGNFNSQTFLGQHFESSGANSEQELTIAHDDSMSLSNQHPDLLSNSLQDGNYYNAPQYFSALDPMQN